MYAINHQALNHLPQELTISLPVSNAWYVLSSAITDMTLLMLKHQEENGFKEIDLLGIQESIEIFENQLNIFKKLNLTSDFVLKIQDCENQIYDLKKIFQSIEVEIYLNM